MSKMMGGELPRRPNVAFLHLDLGIGGAEALVVSLATTLLPPSGDSSNIHLYTTKCEQSHCFSQLKRNSSPPGSLSSSVVVRGRFIPSALFGFGTALLSNLRMCYLALCLVFDMYFLGLAIDVVVLDVLPSPMPLLRFLSPSLPLLYYCHFPDKLLVRNSVNGVVVTAPSSLRSLYRKPLDYVEEWATAFADCVAVNSKFTASVFKEAFPSIVDHVAPEVLYPAINLKDFIPPKDPAVKLSDCQRSITLLSMNRFERKKNIGLAIETMGALRLSLPPETFEKLHLVVAGGYDPSNAENVAHLSELRSLASSLSLSASVVSFRPSVSDAERASLLQAALLVVYTPRREHFGIVPLEAMYAGCAVLAVDEGGPKETVIDGETGFLAKDDKDVFRKKVEWCIKNVDKTVAMGQKGHEHVKNNFGLDKFETAFHALLHKSTEKGRLKGGRRIATSLFVVFCLLCPFLGRAGTTLLVALVVAAYSRYNYNIGK